MTRIVLLVDHSDVVNSSECLDRIVSETVTDISSLLRNYCDETKRAIGTRHSDIVEVPAHAMLATPTGLRALFTVRSKWGTHDELVELSYDECAVRVSPGAGGAPPVVEFRFEPTVCVYEVRGFRCSDDRIALDVTAHYRTPAIDAPDTSADDEECEPEMSEGVAEEEITQKVGTPYFYGADGMKFMSLFVDIGLSFSPNEITVQILKDNIIQVRARHEEKDAYHYIKQKYCRDYELNERIEPYSLRGGLSSTGRLVVGALAKGHKSKDSRCNPMMVLKGKEGEAAVSQPCNVLDLASFPPKAS